MTERGIDVLVGDARDEATALATFHHRSGASLDGGREANGLDPEAT